MPEVFDQFNPPPYDGAVMGGETLVESEGYIPAERQIENMLIAGERLVAGRKEANAYDYAPGDPIEGEIDIRTRRPNYDMADASQDLMEVNARLASQKEAADKAKKEAEEKAKEEPKKDG